eukprot:2422958-Amphidinium_carterae.2
MRLMLLVLLPFGCTSAYQLFDVSKIEKNAMQRTPPGQNFSGLSWSAASPELHAELAHWHAACPLGSVTVTCMLERGLKQLWTTACCNQGCFSVRTIDLGVNKVIVADQEQCVEEQQPHPGLARHCRANCLNLAQVWKLMMLTNDSGSWNYPHLTTSD